MIRVSFRPNSFRPILALAACVLALVARPLAAQGVVRGEVVDEESGQPLPGAAVQLDAYTRVLVDDSGRFTVRVRPGTYRATISRIGYQRQGERWEVGSDTVRVTVRLAVEPLALAAIEARTNVFEERLERQIRAMPVSTRVFGEVELTRSVSPNAADFILTHGGLMRAPCPGSGAFVCVRKRGRTMRLAVFVDERPAFELEEMQTYPLSDIARVEVIDGVRVNFYTYAYLLHAARTGRIPMQ